MFFPPLILIFLLLPSSLLFFPVQVHSLRILQIVPGFTNSHVLFNYRLAATLRAMGHNVTLWTQMEMAMVFAGDLRLPPGVSELRVPIHFRDRLKVQGLKVFQEMIFARGTPYDLWWTGREFQEMRAEACEQMLEGAEEARRRGPFDLAIGHFHDMCPVMLAARVGVDRLVWVTHGTSLYDFTAISLGLRTFPSFVPHPLSSNSDRMTFLGRLTNVLWHLSGIEFVNLPESLLHIENKMYREAFRSAGPRDPDLWALASRTVPVLLINGHRFLDLPRPLPRNIAFMGELAEASSRRKGSGDNRNGDGDELGPELAGVYSRKGSKGVIVFSMGTVSNTTNMPREMAQSFLHAFGNMSDYDFLWKTEQTDLEGAGKLWNVHLRRWIPQKKLMAHPRTLLLLAHGGYNSFLEVCLVPYFHFFILPQISVSASKAGLPVLLVPLFADQHINAERAKRFGIAETLNKTELSAEAVERALRRMLEDPRYSLNARRLSAMLSATPFPESSGPSPAIRHCLHLAMSPRPSLFSLKSAQSLSFFHFHSLDVAAFLVGLIVVVMMAT